MVCCHNSKIYAYYNHMCINVSFFKKNMVLAALSVYVLLETTLGCLIEFSFSPISLLHSS